MASESMTILIPTRLFVSDLPSSFNSFFFADEYRAHTSCISEAERYEKSIYRGARKLDESGTGHRTYGQQGGKNNKLSPQEAWQQIIRVAAEKAPASMKSYMEQLEMLENVPRKLKPFRNFADQVFKLKGPSGVTIKDEIWKLLEKSREEVKKEEEENKKKQQQLKQTPKKDNDVDDVLDPPKKAKSDAGSFDSDNKPAKVIVISLPSEKTVTKAMKKALKKAPNRQLKFKVLRKQVQESLSLEAGKVSKEKWKTLLQGCVDANPKKLLLDGKNVTLVK
jgi:cell growth-regulating nucleolar protein